MYGQSPYSSVMGRGMFMQPQMQQMLQMRDQMRRPQAVQDMQMPLPAQLPSDPYLENISEPARQMQPQEMSTEDSLMQVQQALTNMQQQQQQLSQHLGAGSGMLQQQYQGGLGGLIGQLRPQPATNQGPGSMGEYRTHGPESLRLRLQTQGPPQYQGNPFGA